MRGKPSSKPTISVGVGRHQITIDLCPNQPYKNDSWTYGMAARYLYTKKCRGCRQEYTSFVAAFQTCGCGRCR